jgi:cytosine/adenosine deaminase-related metal-dependent hydrolase
MEGKMSYNKNKLSGNTLKTFKKFVGILSLSLIILCVFNIHIFAEKILYKKIDYLDVEAKKVIPGGYIGFDTGTGKITYASENAPNDLNTYDLKIEGQDFIALPGFINTHTHLWQHMARGLCPDKSLQGWAKQIYKYAPFFNEIEVEKITKAAAGQALLSGITTVLDYTSINYNKGAIEATIKALKEMYMGGGVVFYNPQVFLPYNYKIEYIDYLKKIGPKLKIWMGPGPLSFFSIPVFYDAVLLAKDFGMKMVEHTMENVEEQRALYERLENYLKFYKEKKGDKTEDYIKLKGILDNGRNPSKVDSMENLYRLANQILMNFSDKLDDEEEKSLKSLLKEINKTISPVPIIEYLLKEKIEMKNYLSVHSVWQTKDDIETYKEYGVPVSHNPESNMYLFSGIAPILEYKKNSIPVTIGTDGAASNDGISFFSAIRSMWNLQKLNYLDDEVTKEIDAWYILQAATINGAKALGLDKNTGSIDKGKEADIILLSKKRLGISPLIEKNINQILTLIVYSASPRDVHTVFSDGKKVVENGEIIIAGNEEENLAKCLSYFANIIIDKHSNGKIWKKEYQAKKGSFYHYESVRKKDRFIVEVKNDTEAEITLKIAAINNWRMGANSKIFNKKTIDRFPNDDTGTSYYDKEIKINAGKVLIIEKKSGENKFKITNDKKEEEWPEKGFSGQFFLVYDEENNPPGKKRNNKIKDTTHSF